MKDKVLNTEQIEAIKYGNGPLLIIAGAGTGKTTVITERIKHLILEKHVSPTEILALTFTEKSAREMEERVDIALPYGYTQLWISTFHAFCDRILRSDAIHIGLNPSYRLMTEAETMLFLRKHIFVFQLNYFRPLGNPYKFLSGMLQHFNRLKDEDVNPEEYLKWAKAKNNKEEQEVKKNLELAGAFKTYEELKAKEGVMDYSDLISNTLDLFRKRKNILKQYQEQFKYILVDEFQDTNFAQNTLAVLLSGDKKNITVVGDDDQAIYRWRGAAISNMVQFRKYFPKVKIVTLTKNYRSTQEILNKSHDLILYNNPDRLEVKENINKKLTSERKQKGKDIEILYAERVENEAELVAEKIQTLVDKKKYGYKDFAILVRANDHAQPFVKTLIRFGISYQFLGPGRLFHQEEIKDLIAYLKVLYNFNDNTSLYRLLNFPLFELSARDISALLNFAKRKNLSLFEAIERILYRKSDEQEHELFLEEKTKKTLEKILEMINRHLKRVPKDTAGQILYYFLEDSGLLKKVMAAKVPNDEKKYQNIAKFFDKLKTYETEHDDGSVLAVVDWIDLSMQMGESPLSSDVDWSENNAVNILTIHSSKGLEFPVVFLVNLVSQRFPTRERKEQIPIPSDLIKEILPEGDYHIQEERRLCYVGMTRAKDELYVTFANYYGEGKRERKISPFLYDIFGQKYVDKFLKIEKDKLLITQPSLLDWANEVTTHNTQMKNGTKEESAPQRKITYLSYSQLQAFEVCPLHYKLRFILKIPTQPSSPLSFGISIHSTLRDYFQKKIRKEKVTKKDIEALLKKAWIDEGYESKVHQNEAFKRGIYILERYIGKHDGIKTPLGVEVPFMFSLFNKEQNQTLKIGGRIDRVDDIGNNSIEIVDYKTGTQTPTEKELQNNLQLTVYALAATEVRDKIFNKKAETVKLSLHFLEDETIYSTTRTQEQLDEAKKLLFAKVQEIAQSDFTCSHSMLCQNCEYKMLCSTA